MGIADVRLPIGDLGGIEVCREFPENPFRNNEVQVVQMGEEAFRRWMRLAQAQEEDVGVECGALIQDALGAPGPRAPFSRRR
jgi:hypothetical protein